MNVEWLKTDRQTPSFMTFGVRPSSKLSHIGYKCEALLLSNLAQFALWISCDSAEDLVWFVSVGVT